MTGLHDMGPEIDFVQDSHPLLSLGLFAFASYGKKLLSVGKIAAGIVLRSKGEMVSSASIAGNSVPQWLAGFDEIHLAPSVTSPSGASSIVSIFISVHWVQQCLGSKIGRTMRIISALISLLSSSMTVCYHISQKGTWLVFSGWQHA